MRGLSIDVIVQWEESIDSIYQWEASINLQVLTKGRLS